MLRRQPAVERTKGKVRVAILDDHQGIVDGYVYRLGDHPRIQVVASAAYGEELPALLHRSGVVHVLILDLGVPTSQANSSPFPALHAIPALLEKHPHLHILVVSMYADPGVIRGVVGAGVSGYILKEDYSLVRDLASAVISVADGGICFSARAHEALLAGQNASARHRLSPRQLQALSLCAAYPDMKTEEFARMMQVGHSTVRNLLSSAYVRLEVRTRAAAVERARLLGLITPTSASLPS